MTDRFRYSRFDGGFDTPPRQSTERGHSTTGCTAVLNHRVTLALAPMAAIGHAGFRTLVEGFGATGGAPDEYYSEMIGAGAFVSGGQYEKWYVIDDPAPDKMVWQVVGGDAARLAEAAARLAEKRGIGVDINMGCSAPDILRAGAGAAWLDRDREEIRHMVRAVRDAVKGVDSTKRVSVKMRLCGKGESAQAATEAASNEWLIDTVKMLCDEGVERIALHARGAGEKYRTAAHWAEAEKAAEAAKAMHTGVSVAINGDIKDAPSMRRALQVCPHADCVMVGRQAAVTPWVFALLGAEEFRYTAATVASIQRRDRGSAPPLGNPDMAALNHQPGPLALSIDRERVALDFIALLKRYQPRDFWRTRSKRFFAYYAQGFSFAHYFATQMTNCRDMDEAEARVKDYFARQPSDRILQVNK